MKSNYKFLIYIITYLFVFFFSSIFFYVVIFLIVDSNLKQFTRHDQVIHVPSLVGLNLSDAKDTLKKYQLIDSIIDSAAYNPDYQRGAILSTEPKENTQVKPGRKIYLTINPEKVNYIFFPDLKNKSLRQGISLLENNAFKFGNLYYVEHLAKDAIQFSKHADTLITVSDSLLKFSVIDLYLGKGELEYVIIPNLIGLELNMVKNKLNYNSLNLDTTGLIHAELSDTIRAIVFKQEPEFNEKVPPGSFISVWSKDTLMKFEN